MTWHKHPYTSIHCTRLKTEEYKFSWSKGDASMARTWPSACRQIESKLTLFGPCGRSSGVAVMWWIDVHILRQVSGTNRTRLNRHLSVEIPLCESHIVRQGPTSWRHERVGRYRVTLVTNIDEPLPIHVSPSPSTFLFHVLLYQESFDNNVERSCLGSLGKHLVPGWFEIVRAQDICLLVTFGGFLWLFLRYLERGQLHWFGRRRLTERATWSVIAVNRSFWTLVSVLWYSNRRLDVIKHRPLAT